MNDIFSLLGANVTIPAEDIHVPTVYAGVGTWNLILSFVFTVMGMLSVFFLLLAAWTYVTSGGDSGKIQKAKHAILYAVIGIVVSVSAFTIVQYFLGEVTGAQQGVAKSQTASQASGSKRILEL